MNKLTRNITGVFNFPSRRSSSVSSANNNDEHHLDDSSSHAERQKLHSRIISARFMPARGVSTRIKEKFHKPKRNRRTEGDAGEMQPEGALVNNKPFSKSRSHTVGSVVLKRQWDKFKNVAHSLQENLHKQNSKFNHFNFHIRSSASQADIASQMGSMGSRYLDRLDPQTREAYKELRKFRHADSLEEGHEILDKMREFKKSAEIQYLGTHYLAKLALQEGAGLLQYGAADLIASAMKRFSKSAKVQGSCCLLIWNLAVDDENKVKLSEKSMHKYVVEAMKVFPDNIPLLHMGLGALKLLAADEDIKKKIIDLGGIELLMHCFHRFCQEAPNDADLQETCISSVQNFAHGLSKGSDKDFLNKLLSAKAPHFVIRSMLKFKDNNVLQSAGCAALWNLSIPEEFKVPLAEIGAGNRALSAMLNYADDSNVVLHAMGALKNLSSTKESFDIVVKKSQSGELGKVQIYDIVYDAYVIHQENDSNIRRIGEDLMYSFDVDETERKNSKQSNNTDKNDDRQMVEMKTADQAVDEFDEEYGLDDDDDLKDFFKVEASKRNLIEQSRKNLFQVKTESRPSTVSKASETSRYDPENPFAGLPESDNADELEDEFDIL